MLEFWSGVSLEDLHPKDSYKFFTFYFFTISIEIKGLGGIEGDIGGFGDYKKIFKENQRHQLIQAILQNRKK